jgi:hypothetical protein
MRRQLLDPLAGQMQDRGGAASSCRIAVRTRVREDHQRIVTRDVLTICVTPDGAGARITMRGAAASTLVAPSMPTIGKTRSSPNSVAAIDPRWIERTAGIDPRIFKGALPLPIGTKSTPSGPVAALLA